MLRPIKRDLILQSEDIYFCWCKYLGWAPNQRSSRISNTGMHSQKYISISFQIKCNQSPWSYFIPFGSQSKGKLSPRSYSTQFENKCKSIFLSVESSAKIQWKTDGCKKLGNGCINWIHNCIRFLPQQFLFLSNSDYEFIQRITDMQENNVSFNFSTNNLVEYYIIELTISVIIVNMLFNPSHIV